MAKTGKQKDLPGMEDRGITELQESALHYAGIRDERKMLTRQEVEVKAELLALMKKHCKKTYSYNGVEVELVVEEETVKVRVKKKEPEGAA